MVLRDQRPWFVPEHFGPEVRHAFEIVAVDDDAADS
jgi:hypothetical protein